MYHSPGHWHDGFGLTRLGPAARQVPASAASGGAFRVIMIPVATVTASASASVPAARRAIMMVLARLRVGLRVRLGLGAGNWQWATGTGSLPPGSGPARRRRSSSRAGRASGCAGSHGSSCGPGPQVCQCCQRTAPCVPPAAAEWQ
jgi:hypothetical protein